MEITIIILLVTAIVLLILSFTKKDRINELQEEVETLSLTVMQDTYQIKKKIKILEEELLFQGDDDFLQDSGTVNITKERDTIIRLYQKGFTIEEISEQASLPLKLVEQTIQDLRRRGFQA